MKRFSFWLVLAVAAVGTTEALAQRVIPVRLPVVSGTITAAAPGLRGGPARLEVARAMVAGPEVVETMATTADAAAMTGGRAAAVGEPLAVPDASVTRYVHHRLNVRAGPGTGHRVLFTLAAGEEITVGPQDGRGWSVLFGDQGVVRGYVYRAGTTVRSDPPGPPAP
ncbi:MAG TPA: SH3 domain-containing protein [Longimicrobium sp.]